MLSKVISNAKKLHYNKVILGARNKMRATWKIINNEKGITYPEKSVPLIIYDDIRITNQQKIANVFNNYYLSAADRIYADTNKDDNSNAFNPINYLFKGYNKPFPKIKWHYASAYEIEKNIQSIKTTNTAGYKEISNRIIKLSSPYTISPLTHICIAAL